METRFAGRRRHDPFPERMHSGGLDDEELEQLRCVGNNTAFLSVIERVVWQAVRGLHDHR